MSTNVVDSPPAVVGSPQSVADLVSGIVSDAERLFKQQVEMVRSEFKEDLRQTKQIVLAMSVGAVLLAVGVVMLIVALAHVLHEQAQLPMSASWAIVGGAVVLLGIIAAVIGGRILASYNPLPDKSFNALQENVSWITNPQK
ncbi:MAG TPA: phage holin family protein [Fimbriiglobus sp.]|nr:phage holin family protein [Fimbriiglobus sp.]